MIIGKKGRQAFFRERPYHQSSGFRAAEKRKKEKQRHAMAEYVSQKARSPQDLT